MEKGRPVDIFRQLGQRKILVNLEPQEFWFFRIFRPVKTGGIFSGFRDGQQLLGRAPTFEILPRFFLVGSDLRYELFPLLRGKKLLGHPDNPGSVDHVDHWAGISRGDLHRGVGGTGRCTSDQQGQGHLLPFHLRSHGHHFVQRRGDEATQPNHIHPAGFGLRQDLFARDHHPKIDHFIPVAGQHHSHDVFPDVVHVSLDRGHKNPAGLRFGPSRLLLFHEWGEIGHRFLHHSRTFYYLRQKHFTLPEQIPHVPHPPHQGSLDHFKRPSILLTRLLRVLVDVIRNSLQEGVKQTLIHRPSSPGLVLHGRFAPGLDRLRKLQHALRGIRSAVQQHILHALLKIGGNFLVNRQLTGVDDGHIQAGLDGMVEKAGVHRFPDGVIPAKRKGNIAESAACFTSRQGFFDLPDRLDEFHGIPVVLLDSGRHR